MPANTDRRPSVGDPTPQTEPDKAQIDLLKLRLAEAGATGTLELSVPTDGYRKYPRLTIPLVGGTQETRDQAVLLLADDIIRVYEAQGSSQSHDLSLSQLDRGPGQKHYYLKNPNFFRSRSGSQILMEIDGTPEAITIHTATERAEFLRSYARRIGNSTPGTDTYSIAPGPVLPAMPIDAGPADTRMFTPLETRLNDRRIEEASGR